MCNIVLWDIKWHRKYKSLSDHSATANVITLDSVKISHHEILPAHWEYNAVIILASNNIDIWEIVCYFYMISNIFFKCFMNKSQATKYKNTQEEMHSPLFHANR